MSTVIARESIIAAAARIRSYVHKTPLLSSTQLNEIAGAELYFKCENFQKSGSYKIRGALNAALQIRASARSRGLITHSSGNFAQAVAIAAKFLEVPAYIVMPSNAPSVKVEAVDGYKGLVIRCGPTLYDREQTCARVVAETGGTFLHPSNNLHVIQGQGTATLELLNEVPDLEYVVCPVGGGGLVAGACLAAAQRCQVYGAEPFEADDAYRSLQSGKIESNSTTNTIADGLRTQLGDINFPIIQTGISGIIRVTEPEIIAAMELIWTRLKIVVEPSSAVTLAAILREPERWQGKKVGLLISGGNIDLSRLPFGDRPALNRCKSSYIPSGV